MRVYYELTLWEEIGDYDTDILKGKMAEMAKRFVGFGCMSFNMRGTPPVVQTPPPSQPQESPPPPSQQPQVQEEVIDE